ncbi:hypothetical protein CesoFtcFv8_019210 [Champsocephalus esox]|uniref:Uncharacterized protein n=1 Tax=Champsocephalus esox TaxID=159716 RepID=A0AAN8BI26_9TELE|nr:hypothetical protein CesoFtcFv8_019210 [Champsocephalus esox]
MKTHRHKSHQSTAVISVLHRPRSATAEQRGAIQRPHPPGLELFRNRPSGCTVREADEQELKESSGRGASSHHTRSWEEFT